MVEYDKVGSCSVSCSPTSGFAFPSSLLLSCAVSSSSTPALEVWDDSSSCEEVTSPASEEASVSSDIVCSSIVSASSSMEAWAPSEESPSSGLCSFWTELSPTSLVLSPTAVKLCKLIDKAKNNAKKRFISTPFAGSPLHNMLLPVFSSEIASAMHF